MRYELLVIGNSPAGREGALAAAALDQAVAIIHPSHRVGSGIELVGNSVLSFPALRELLLDVPEVLRNRTPGWEQGPEQIDLAVVRQQLLALVAHDRQVVRDQMERREIRTFSGNVSFRGPHDVLLQQTGGFTREFAGNQILLAGVAVPIRSMQIPFDGKLIYGPNELLLLDRLPRVVHIIGGGSTGLRCGVLLAELGSRVTVVDGRADLQAQTASDKNGALWDAARELGVQFQLGEDVLKIKRRSAEQVSLLLESGREIQAASVLVATGNTVDTARLELEQAGLSADERGRIWCNNRGRTWAPNIFAAGDAVGFPPVARSIPASKAYVWD